MLVSMYPEVAATRKLDPSAGLVVLDQLARLIEIVDQSLYEEYEHAAIERMSSRDVTDWPIAATSLLLGCPVWTEDQDFFGSRIATWTSNNVELYLRDA
jgi:predicted nucleic acid-binding protein